MHTFYEKTEVGQDDVLKLWKEEWSRAGFDTSVLTLDDAKNHPYFEEMEERVERMFDSSDYQGFCFYRWLAMATVGGGWMSDYDIFPTNFPLSQGVDLPNGGNFTSFEVHVPSLMSGRAEEWTRVSKLLIDAISRTAEAPTDIQAFKILLDEQNTSIEFLSKYNVQLGLVYKTWRKVDCESMRRGRAVHMSHTYIKRAYDKKLFPTNDIYGPASTNRAKAIQIFMDDWREQCNPAADSRMYNVL